MGTDFSRSFRRRVRAISFGATISLTLLIAAFFILPGSPASSQTNSAVIADDDPDFQLQRPKLTDEQARQIADELRKEYTKPPDQWPAPFVDKSVQWTELGLLPPPEYPADNPYSKEKEELGRLLFFDPRLSKGGQISCATCHDPDQGWSDSKPVSIGHEKLTTKRNSPGVMYSAYTAPLFADGRAATLEEQFHGPLTASNEMAAVPAEVEKRLSAIPEYRKLFKAAFGSEAVTIADAAKAVATFQRALANHAGHSKFDQFLKGKTDALSDSAIRGLDLFRRDGRCMNCHFGPAMTDNQFHNLGLSFYGQGEKLEDRGRYDITKDPKDVGSFRTPTVRDVMSSAPYVHNGLFGMNQLLNIYKMGGITLYPANDAQRNDPLFPTKDRLLKPLPLNARDIADLKAFMDALTEPKLAIRPESLPPDPS